MRPSLWILAATALLLAFGGGYFAGHNRANRVNAPSTATNGNPASNPLAYPANPAVSTQTKSASPDFSGEWSRDLTALAAISSSLVRADQARLLADVAPLTDIGRILELAENLLPDDTLFTFVERLLHRLAPVDPLEALRRVDRYSSRGLDWSLREVVIEAWIGSDAPAAIRWFESLGPGNTRMRVESALVTALARRAPDQGLALLKRTPAGPFRDGFLGEFFSHWAQSDPAAAARAGRELLAQPRHAAVLGSVVGQWARRDPTAARAMLMALPDGSIRRQAIVGAIETLASTSPAHAAQLALDISSGTARGELFGIVARHWGVTDRAAAIQWAESIGDPKLQRQAITALIESVASSNPASAIELLQRHRIDGDNEGIFRTLGSELASDPQATLAWLDTLPTSGARQAAFGGLMESWSVQNPTAAATFATNLPPGARRLEAINAVASALAGSDPASAIVWLQGLPAGQEKINAAQNMVWQFAQSDPRQGLALLESLPAGSGRNQLFGSLMSGWADHDLDGAVNWVTTTPDSPERRTALGNIAGQWASNDPIAAATFASSLPPGVETDGFLSNIAITWASQDPQAALDWAQKLPASMANSVLEEVIGQWANQSPADALAIAQSLTDPDTQRSSVLAAVNSWAGSNPAEAARWLESQPPGDTRTAAASSLVGTWAASDPVSAAQWLAGQPEAVRSDQVMASLANSLAQFEPTSALQWAGAIRDPDRRQRELVRLGQNWIQNFPSEARNWLQQSDLDAATRQMIEAVAESDQP